MIQKLEKKYFVKAKKHTLLTTGEVIKFLREFKEISQQELANQSGITTTNLSLLENNKIDIGKKRAIQIAKVFNIHPAIIMFPEYPSTNQSLANFS
jgi:transcriptional regulator with XRE-family HTH domain